MLARRMLNRQTGTKQIIMITDGEPTAHITPSGRPFFSYPPTRETGGANPGRGGQVHPRRHPDQHVHAGRHTSYLTNFVERITELNGGRAFFTTNENLGDYVLVDFVEHKRSLVHARR